MISSKDPHRGSNTVTSEQWWSEVKNDPERFQEWLIKQHRGEVTAASRIERFAATLAPNDKCRKTLKVIAEQELQHAGWVLGLLETRGVTPNTSHAEERYWKEVLPEGAVTFEEVAAIGAHAEAMRLERIRAIVADEDAPTDVREVFQRIVKDEIFHERAFRKMAGDVAMAKTRPSHDRGRQVLGLEA